MTWQYNNDKEWIFYDANINKLIEGEFVNKNPTFQFHIKQQAILVEYCITFSKNSQTLIGNCIFGTNCNKCKFPQGRHFRQIRRLDECCICFDTITNSSFLICDNNHTICGNSCINNLVESQLDEIPNRVNNGNKIDVIKCPSCDFMYKTQTLLPKLNEDTYNKLMLVRDSCVGALAQKEIMNNNNNNNNTNKHRDKIINDILTLKCPHCNISFIDWDLHCLSFECSNCRERFCGACLFAFYNHDHGGDHILNDCDYNPHGKNKTYKSIFLTRGNELIEFNKLHNERKINLIKIYLKDFSLNEKELIINSISKELIDLEIDKNLI
jgi:hypothetical protein